MHTDMDRLQAFLEADPEARAALEQQIEQQVNVERARTRFEHNMLLRSEHQIVEFKHRIDELLVALANSQQIGSSQRAEIQLLRYQQSCALRLQNTKSCSRELLFTQGLHP